MNKLIAFLFLLYASASMKILYGQKLLIKYDEKGVESLAYNGVTLINSKIAYGSPLLVETYKTIARNGKVSYALSSTKKQSWNPTAHQFIGDFQWGQLTCTYSQLKDTLLIAVTLKNNSVYDTLCGVNVWPLVFQFSEKPSNFYPDIPYYNINTSGPTIIEASFKNGKLIVCNEDVKQNDFIGLVGEGNSDNKKYRLWVSSIQFGGMSSLTSVIDKKIAPGKSYTYNISVRFCNPDATIAEAASHIIKKYRLAWPLLVKWKDRRPIGQLVLSSVEKTTPHSNPRGFLPNEDVDIEKSPKLFRNKILNYADRSIDYLNKIGAQGMITWDIEGQEFPHPISYPGAPERMNDIAPEMVNIADEYFAKFRKAGFRVGVCIRPDSVLLDKRNRSMKRLVKNNMFSILAKRINYAKKRWGCTLFYIDSNGDPNYPIDADVFRKLYQKFPDVLLIPEHQNTKYYAYTAPYEELRFGIYDIPNLTKLTYPDCFQILNISEAPGEYSSKLLKIKTRNSSNIFMVRAWYNDNEAFQLLKTATGETK